MHFLFGYAILGNTGGHLKVDALRDMKYPTPFAEPSRMSHLGESPAFDGSRRLFVGTGIGGMGVQCGVDVPGRK